MTRPGWENAIGVVASIVLGGCVGWVDVHATEVQGPVLAVIVSTFLVSLALPRLFWLWALLIGGSILPAHLVARAFGVVPAYALERPFTALIALVPAFLGAGLGVATRMALERSRTE